MSKSLTLAIQSPEGQKRVSLPVTSKTDELYKVSLLCHSYCFQRRFTNFILWTSFRIQYFNLVLEETWPRSFPSSTRATGIDMSWPGFEPWPPGQEVSTSKRRELFEVPVNSYSEHLHELATCPPSLSACVTWIYMNTHEMHQDIGRIPGTCKSFYPEYKHQALASLHVNTRSGLWFVTSDVFWAGSGAWVWPAVGGHPAVPGPAAAGARRVFAAQVPRRRGAQAWRPALHVSQVKNRPGK